MAEATAEAVADFVDKLPVASRPSRTTTCIGTDTVPRSVITVRTVIDITESSDVECARRDGPTATEVIYSPLGGARLPFLVINIIA